MKTNFTIQQFPLNPRHTAINFKWFRLDENFVTSWIFNTILTVLTIPRGYEWDGATIPQIVWTLIGMYPGGILTSPSVVHDWIYVNKGWIEVEIDRELQWVKITRKQCDQLFYLHCIEAGLPKKKALKLYKTLRKVGWIKWADNRLVDFLRHREQKSTKM